MSDFSEEFNVLKRVCEGLEQVNIPYMLTGSLAANYYAVPRLTRDIDIVVEILYSDRDKVFRVFEKDFYFDRNAMLQAVEYEGMFNIIHYESVFKVDFIVRKDSEYRKAEFQRKHRVEFGGTSIWIVSPEDLILSKLLWAKDSLSEMQLKDVRNLFNALKSLDEAYIFHWVQILKLNTIYEKVCAK